MAEESDRTNEPASSRPVSSLLSHFEGLKQKQAAGIEGTHTRETAPSSKSLHPAPQLAPKRSSFDLSRPSSPWTPVEDTRHALPRTPGSSDKRSLSPPKPGHRRPMSMLIGSSPQLTPSVHVVSPRSPPRTYFDRSVSRSPDHQVDNTPFGKVRELISQHSSRASSPLPTPRPNSADPAESAPTVPTGLGLVIQPSNKTKPPPPVKRADKPKIPAKPNVLINQGLTTLAAEARSPVIEARVSPFSTPPSSDEDRPPSQSPDINAVSRPSPAPIATRKFSGQIAQTSMHTSTAQQQRDPRTMGLSASSPRSNPQFNDPRTLGFSKTENKTQSMEMNMPARANTISERPSSRDPRDLGFGASKVTHRHVSENVRSLPTSMTTTPAKIPSSTMTRDARQFGFSSFTGTNDAIVEEPKPELPRRIAGKVSSQPHESRKDHEAQVGTGPSPQIPTHRSIKSVQPESLPIRQAATVSDVHFLPPPKRNAQYPGEPSLPNQRPSFDRQASPVSRVTQLDPDSEDGEVTEEPVILKTDYPDATQTNRRPPYFHADIREIHTRSESRAFDISGQWLCTAGYGITRVFDMKSGDAVLGLNHGENIKVTSVLFKPAGDLRQEGKLLWLGTNHGEIQEVDVKTHTVVTTNSSHSRCEVVNILRHRKDIWSIDEDGKLFIWKADESGSPSLRYSHLSHKVQRGHTFSMTVTNTLWHATGKEFRVYKPGNESTFATLAGPFSQHGTGDITSGTTSDEHGGRVYLGHTDGRVTVYSSQDYNCVGNVKASDYKINSLVFVCNKLWAAYKTGKVYVYDTASKPWKVNKDFKAHADPTTGMLVDASSVWTMGRLQVVTAGLDHYVRLWDAMLEDDVVESSMQNKDVQYCQFREVRAAVVTWNAGACIPWDAPTGFIADAIDESNPPEIVAFGFQEVVDLEDRSITAKSLLKFAKKKDPVQTEQHQGKVYREWRDFLIRALHRETEVRYVEISTIHLVGLFQCIFVREDQREKVRYVHATNVKCGMGGHLGNKGALITRLVLDDSSICFVNCHLAAGQTHTSHRNNDVAKILESESLQVESHPTVRSSLYVGGGDGSQILDHEICILNGDLNYRIDAIPRDTVIRMIRNNELAKLLERDQIMVSRRRVAGFRLSPFTELPITFAPTYKYDVRTDDYDTSEKKRSPAWCDRILYRGLGKVKQLEYRRHDVRVSDHRPVSGLFQMRIKTIDPKKREAVMKKCYEEFAAVKKNTAEAVCVKYLVEYLGMEEERARAILREK